MTKFQNFIFNPLATLNSISPLIMIFLVKHKNEKFMINIIKQSCLLNKCLNGLIYFAIMVVVTFGILLLSKLLEKSSQNFEENSIASAHDTFIPSYLGFFFVALSIPDENYLTFGCVLFLILICIYKTNGFFYNPLFIIFGFKYYYISEINKKRILLISRRKDFNVTSQNHYKKLYRINDFTFIDWEKY